jgi:hypothetical protein
MTYLLIFPHPISNPANNLQQEPTRPLCRLHKAQIIPTVLRDFMPRCELSLTYESGPSSSYPVFYGNHISPNKTESEPVVGASCYGLPRGGVKSGLVLVLTDPDAPSRSTPKWGEMCHWVYMFPSNPGQGQVVKCRLLCSMSLLPPFCFDFHSLKFSYDPPVSFLPP